MKMNKKMIPPVIITILIVLIVTSITSGNKEEETPVKSIATNNVARQELLPEDYEPPKIAGTNYKFVQDLLSVTEIMELTEKEELLTAELNDTKMKIQDTSPSQAQAFDAYFTQNFSNKEKTKTLVLTVIDFPEERKALAHFNSVYSGIYGLENRNKEIGDKSAVLASPEENEVGGLAAFVKKDRFIQLHLSGEESLLGIEDLETLAIQIEEKIEN